MAVQPNLLPSHSKKTLGAIEAERTVKRITFNPSEANPGETLYVSMPKLSEHEVIVSGSLTLVFNINLNLTGTRANNYLVQNVSRALVDKLAVKFAATTVQDTDGYDIYKIFEDLFLSADERANMLSEGIQSVDLCRIRSGSGDKKTTGVDAENKLQSIYTNKYRINLDHPILSDHGVFYPQALYNDLIFELTLAPAAQVVRGSDPSKLVYKLENIQLEYETIRSKRLADEATSTYANGKEFAYDLVMREHVVPVNRGSDTRLNLRVNPQRRSLKGILLLFINPYTAGARDSESYFNPDITKVQVTVNGVPNRIYNEGISGSDMWNELTRYFNQHTRTRQAQHESDKIPHCQQVWPLDRPAVHGGHHPARQRPASREHTGWRTTRDRTNSVRLGNLKLLHLHHLGLADEHHGKAAGISSVLGTAPHANPHKGVNAQGLQTHQYREAWTPKSCPSTP